VDLSVVIATHNRPDKLAATVACLMAQRVASFTYEIIVVDDGSVRPVSLLESEGETRCTLIRLEGMGRSAARNAGALVASGDILVFIDDDITVKSDFLPSHLVAQREWAGSIAVGSVLLPEHTQLTPFGRFRQRLESTGGPQSRGLTLMRNYCIASNMSVSKQRFELLGGFDGSIESGEDQDLALRHTGRGGRIVFLPEAEGIHNDTALDIRSYCARSEWGMEHIFPFCGRHPEWPDNVVRAQVNGEARLGREPFGRTFRKAAKVCLATRPALSSMFTVASLLERTAPRSAALDWCYRLLLGVHIFRGYRRGLKRSQSVGRVSLNNRRSATSVD
jgi:glycosyltransferase involved in cell wall biosynthesis